ncbi:MAG: hypothetical protein GXO89_11230 [Chlorobi bacterium]|nr:hypothetical protein [Chlorobiota bacterium]
MFFILGAGHKSNEEYQLETISHCGHCNNDSKWMIGKVTHKASLFFVPLVPYKTEFITYCPICKNGHMISKGDFEWKLLESNN